MLISMGAMGTSSGPNNLLMVVGANTMLMVVGSMGARSDPMLMAMLVVARSDTVLMAMLVVLSSIGASSDPMLMVVGPMGEREECFQTP